MFWRLLLRGGSAAGAAVPARSETPQAEARATQTLSQVARLMAERTTQSWTTAPHFFVTREIDAGALLAAREKFGPAIEKERGVRLSHTDLLIAAVAHALEKHPLVNASWTGDGIRLNPEINVGIAMAVDDGVVVAAIPGGKYEKARRNRRAAPRPDRAGARRQIAARRHHGRDVHHQQSWHVPGGRVHRDHRRAASGDPGRGTHRRPRRARRWKAGDSPHDDRSRFPATTASSMARGPPCSSTTWPLPLLNRKSPRSSATLGCAHLLTAPKSA